MLRLPLILVCSSVIAQASDRQIATGWTSPESGDYQVGLDHKVVHGGHSSLFLKSAGANATDYAARQRIRADAYRGKRIRLTGWVKPDNAEQGGALWLRIDMANGDYVLDGMLDLSARDRTGKDANGWTRCVLVAQVPADALGISFGLRMRGKGEIWADDLSVELATRQEPTNTIERRPYRAASGKEAAIKELREQYSKAPSRPVNLGFEQP